MLCSVRVDTGIETGDGYTNRAHRSQLHQQNSPVNKAIGFRLNHTDFVLPV